MLVLECLSQAWAWEVTSIYPSAITPLRRGMFPLIPFPLDPLAFRINSMRILTAVASRHRKARRLLVMVLIRPGIILRNLRQAQIARMTKFYASVAAFRNLSMN